MPIQSLGIFDSVFDWVCDKLFDPLINWLSNILNSIFQWIIDQIIVPLIKPVFEFIWNMVIANIMDVFYKMIYNGYCELLWIFDQLQSGFDVLIGLQDVTYVGSDGVKTQSTMLEYFINNETVRNALISITFVALALSMIFAIYSVIRSTLDFDFEGKRPVGKVLNSVAKTMIAFLLVPLIAVVGIQLASIVLKQTCVAISGTTDSSLGRWVLAITSMDAGMGNPPASFTGADGQIAEPWASLIAGNIDYVAFGTKIHESRVDYILGYISLIFMGIVLTICLFTFIKRLFDIVLLYITSPYFVSTIVLDDGEKFRRWRETFIAKLLVGYGSVIGLRIFLMMVPAIMSDQLSIFDSVAGNATGGYVIRLVFILGGMFAVYKSSTLLTGIISSSVATNENASNAVLSGVVTGGAIKGAKAVAGVTFGAFSELRQKKREKSETKENKFSDDMGQVNIPNQAKFSEAYAAAVAGEHKEIDTSDYAPLLGKNDYLKEGVKARTVREHYEADEGELMSDVRNMFGDGQEEPAPRSLEDAYDAAMGQHDTIDTSDYDPNAGVSIFTKEAMEADRKQKENAAQGKGVVGRGKARIAAAARRKSRMEAAKNPLMRKARRANKKSGAAKAAGAPNGSDISENGSMNLRGVSKESLAAYGLSESGTPAGIAERYSAGNALAAAKAESHSPAADNSASSRSAAFTEQPSVEPAATMNTGASVKEESSGSVPERSSSHESKTAAGGSVPESSSYHESKTASGGSVPESGTVHAASAGTAKAAAPAAAKVVPTVDPLSVHKKTDHKNESGKF